MQIKNIFVALGFASAVQAAAIAAPAPVEARAPISFKLRKFTPKANFDPTVAGTWSSNQHVKTVSPGLYSPSASYDDATICTYDAGASVKLRCGGLAPRSLYTTSARPNIMAKDYGDVLEFSIGPGPLHEVTFIYPGKTQSFDAGVFVVQGGVIYTGRKISIDSSITTRFFAEGYVDPA